MTTVTIGKHYIKVEGHSGYAERGKDIVCAAISTLVEATYNYLKALGNDIQKTDDDGLFIIEEKTYCITNQAGNQIFKEFEIMISELAVQYPSYIQILKLL